MQRPYLGVGVALVNDLTRPSRVAELLRQFELAPSKGLGQNFLVDRNALTKIVDAAEINSNDTCLEVGPGLGTLTRELAERARSVIAIEKDKKLSPVLAHTLSSHPNVKVHFADALQVDIAALLADYEPPFKVVANLPYYVTTPLVMTLLESPVPFLRLVILVQKEVAERMCATPQTGDYGALSLAVQYYSEVSIVAKITPNCFFPPPKVASSVVMLQKRTNPAAYYGVKSPDLLFKLVRAAFGQRRKTLHNALSQGLDLERSDVQSLLQKCNIPENARGETLDLAAFVSLANTALEVI